ncbi:MAG: hypothetical protein C4B55_02990 [Candidatus Methanophagaceae archaeon]|nr:MAG: hypothetical protein C4B55_02990 [Methanophagales archaeon]
MIEMQNKKIALGTLLVLLAGGIGKIGKVSALSNAGSGDWSYYDRSSYKEVEENTGKSLTDFQVLVELSAGTFPASAKRDGADLRFKDGI